jgi:hypothetical protein
MKTTLDIADGLFAQAKLTAQRDGVTLRALVEDGLRLALAARQKPAKPFKLKDCSVGSKGAPGLTDEAIARGGWAALRDMTNDRDFR